MRMVLETLETRLLLNADGLDVSAELIDGMPDDVADVGDSDPEILYFLRTLGAESESDGESGDELGDPAIELVFFADSFSSCGGRLIAPEHWIIDGEDDGGSTDDGEGGSDDAGETDGENDFAMGSFRAIRVGSDQEPILEFGSGEDADSDGDDSDADGDAGMDDDSPPELICLYTLAGSGGGAAEHQGPDEFEPNDSIDTSTFIELQPFPTFAPGLSLFGADVQGIAGSDSDDQDYYSFQVDAGYHVNLGVETEVVVGGESFGSIDDWFLANGLNEFGDPADVLYVGGTPLFNEMTGETIDRIEYILGNHPELIAGAAQIVVCDADGNVVAESGANGRSFGVDFDSNSGGTYYAIVSMNADASSGDLVPYRLGILVQSGFDISWVLRGESGEPIEPRVVKLRGGDSLDFTDSSGDDVEVEFHGRGTATITFTGHRADGSDIASIVINGARRGRLTVQSPDGSTDVGSIEIHQATRGRHARGFGRVEVDGNLGSFTSDLDVRALVVDGMLGDVTASAATIGSLRAEYFDAGTADIGSILDLHVQEEGSDDLFRLVLAWE